MSNDQSDERDERDLPSTAAKSGLPQGGSSGAGGKAPPGSPESEDIRRNVIGGPADETEGPIHPDDKYGSKRGAAAAMDPNQPPAQPSDVFTDEKADPPAGVSVEGVRRGEEIGLGEQEEGRQRVGDTGAGRPAGTRNAEDSTGIDPEGKSPDDPDSPEMPPR